MSFLKIEKVLKAAGIKTIKAELKDYTTVKIGGRARVFALAENFEQLKTVFQTCRRYNKPYFVLGAGSNILAHDKKLNYVFVKLAGRFEKITQGSNRVVAGAGVPLFKLNAFFMQNGFGGMEFSFGIPGTVGGAVFMNAGAYGGQMSEWIFKVYYTDGNKVFIKRVADLEFGYRTSCFCGKDLIILKVVFKIQKSDTKTVTQKCKEYLQKRIASQPYTMPSAGSVFKKFGDTPAPVFIEETGLKGKSAGAAQISPKHCGFIVNNGGAKFRQVFKLITKIRKTVSKKFGIILTREVIIIPPKEE
ncbi:MAG: UDP-N-acetylmuramate dehydrogenase [Christensenellaceae bacterium]|jgi:UDP-N-acetylmuramate dehydrogenase|nr:UDP-N-acetylmuramate dehydrogenase [Christensenellaceae bacterium]